MNSIIYLDYAATTPVAPEVVTEMQACLGLDGVFANPAARSHRLGWLAEQRVEDARMDIADCLHADAREIVFTSGATEANNLALKGFMQANCEPGDELIVSSFEHKAVLDVADYLEREGFVVKKIKPQADGCIAASDIQAAINERTKLISIMHVNNETGAINPIAEIAALCQQAGVAFHVDAAQSLGKLPLSLGDVPIDLLSASAHKFYGPKGAGFLFVRRRNNLRLEMQMHGGGHERGFRSGTLATHQIVGMAKALQLACADLKAEAERAAKLRQVLLDVLAPLDGVEVNQLGTCVAHILNVRFTCCDAESLRAALPQLAMSSGSACNSAHVAPSYVLKELGLSDRDALNSLRLSFGRYSTEQELGEAAQLLANAVSKLS